VRRPPEIVVYLPASRATADIVRGSAVVGQPRPLADEVKIYFEGSIYGAPQNVRTLADRARHAAGRMVEEYPTAAMRVVPRDALVAVGTFDLRSGRIMLTGPQSERAVADWLGMPQLDPTELRPTGVGRPVVPSAVAAIEPGLLRDLMERGGVRPDGDEWVASDGRRTAAVGDALLWALESIAHGTR
jgi:hypothetical protein